MVAIFDLDGTITVGDTYVAYLLYVLRRRRNRIFNCITLPMRALQFGFGRITNDEVKSAFLKGIAGGCARCEIERFTDQFLGQRVTKMIKPRARARIDWHRQQGHVLVLATASFDLYADAIGRSLGFDHVIATRAAWYNDRLTGDIDGENLRGEAKLAAVTRLLLDLNRGESKTVVYSDSQSDLPILRLADYGVVVDPAPSFAKVANLYGFAVESWRGKSEDPELADRSEDAGRDR